MDNDAYILGVFSDEEKLLSAIKKVREMGAEIIDVFEPYPVHGVEKAAGIRKTRLTAGALIYGVLGASLTLGFIYWASVISYPLIYGGKPLNAMPSYIVVTFVMTINIASFLSVVTFLIRTKMYPGKQPKMVDFRVTDDKFVIAIEKNSNMNNNEIQAINDVLVKNGAIEVKEQILK